MNKLRTKKRHTSAQDRLASPWHRCTTSFCLLISIKRHIPISVSCDICVRTRCHCFFLFFLFFLFSITFSTNTKLAKLSDRYNLLNFYEQSSKTSGQSLHQRRQTLQADNLTRHWYHRHSQASWSSLIIPFKRVNRRWNVSNLAVQLLIPSLPL